MAIATTASSNRKSIDNWEKNAEKYTNKFSFLIAKIWNIVKKTLNSSNKNVFVKIYDYDYDDKNLIKTSFYRLNGQNINMLEKDLITKQKDFPTNKYSFIYTFNSNNCRTLVRKSRSEQSIKINKLKEKATKINQIIEEVNNNIPKEILPLPKINATMSIDNIMQKNNFGEEITSAKFINEILENDLDKQLDNFLKSIESKNNSTTTQKISSDSDNLRQEIINFSLSLKSQ